MMAETKANWEALWQPAADALEDARWLLKRTEAQLNARRLSSKAIRYANRYFLTGEKGIAPADLLVIQSTVTKTLNGLSGHVTLKVGAETSRGYVSGFRGGANNHVKPYHNTVVDSDDGIEKRQGAIHVSEDRIQEGRYGVKTLIHEATHKYAGTGDYCYFNDNSVTPRGTFDDKAKALCNADSYAWFVLKVGRTFFGGNNIMFR